jgi:hypothetical protein
LKKFLTELETWRMAFVVLLADRSLTSMPPASYPLTGRSSTVGATGASVTGQYLVGRSAAINLQNAAAYFAETGVAHESMPSSRSAAEFD